MEDLAFSIIIGISLGAYFGLRNIVIIFILVCVLFLFIEAAVSLIMFFQNHSKIYDFVLKRLVDILILALALFLTWIIFTKIASVMLNTFVFWKLSDLGDRCLGALVSGLALFIFISFFQ